MTTDESSPPVPATFNLANQITIARLVASVAVFVLIEFQLFGVATVLFIVAVCTDYLDGYIARTYQLETVLGRILDPLVDKVIIGGTFIYLATLDDSGVFAWMVVVIIGREMLVTGLRSFFEKHGSDFSASLWGKLKMVTQSVTIGVVLAFLAYSTSQEAAPEFWLVWTRDLLIYSSVIITVVSGLIYVQGAIELTKNLPQS